MPTLMSGYCKPRPAWPFAQLSVQWRSIMCMHMRQRKTPHLQLGAL